MEELLAAAESGEGSRRRKLADGDLTIEEIREQLDAANAEAVKALEEKAKAEADNAAAV